MAILREGFLETNSLFLNTDWYNEGNEVIDETTLEGQTIVNKILEFAPFHLIVRDSEGTIVDVEENVEARLQWEQEQAELEAKRPPTETERLEALESAMLYLLFEGGAE